MPLYGFQRRALFSKRGQDFGAAVRIRRGCERGKFSLGSGNLAVRGGNLAVYAIDGIIAFLGESGQIRLRLGKLGGEAFVFLLGGGNAATVIVLNGGYLSLQLALAALQGADLALQGGDALRVRFRIEAGNFFLFGGNIALHLGKLAFQRRKGLVKLFAQGGKVGLCRGCLRGQAVARLLRRGDARFVIRRGGSQFAFQRLQLGSQGLKLSV